MAQPFLARVGRFVFPLRGHLGIPFLLLALRVCTPTDLPPLILGWTVLLIGLFMRLWGVAGWVPTRLGGVQPDRLITQDGPYVFTRNPRYLGNLLMGLGGCCLAGLPQCLAAYFLVWMCVHVPIVSYEEENLSQRWGPEYQAYLQRVPRFLGWPRQALGPQLRGLRWHHAFCLEMSTIAGWLSLGLFLQVWRLVGLGWPGWYFYLVPVGAALIWGLLFKLKGQPGRS
ncbi:hypothetical protein JST97_29890 [bacterium]|nr:hypothetical protein [bacterium]